MSTQREIPIPADMPLMREALEAATKAQHERDEALDWGGGAYLDKNMWKRRAERLQAVLTQIAEYPDADMFVSLAPAQAMRAMAKDALACLTTPRREPTEDGQA